jgi:hypothetical protein
MTLYHGSQVQEIDKVKPNYSSLVNHKVVYGSTNFLVALIMGTGWRDDQIGFGKLNGKFYLEERTRGAFQKFLTRPTCVYEIENKSFHWFSELCSFELVSDIAHSPIKFTLILNPFEIIKNSELDLMSYQENNLLD